MKQVNDKTQCNTKGARHRPREHADELCQQPYGQIFEPVSHSTEVWTVTSAAKYFKFACNRGPRADSNPVDTNRSRGFTMVAGVARRTHENCMGGCRSHGRFDG